MFHVSNPKYHFIQISVCQPIAGIAAPVSYEPRWFMAPSHMNPQETVRAFQELQAKKLLIVHWGTFRLGDEPVHFPPIQLREELKKIGLEDRMVDLQHGETYFL